ncbi:BMC domain-containing protein [uncultured Pseudodesulfovibrio sp.]|uniref:BMC domain-containing protein n=1 Tax=uncultured Pseudodesulfovibrio sp. TaxID=2035858 RepID=UPI0029C91A0E|nr:BMC domain-containing protein [uncultured Pseudodesulfovibrio sp.]
MTAIGFIETWGLVPAVEAADAMLKAADVRLLERTQVGSGLVTITVAGTVSAVQASVDAAAAAIGRIEGGVLVSRHVIARPDEEVASVIRTCPVAEARAEAPVAQAAPVAETPAPIQRRSASELKKMKVAELRKLARSLTGEEPSSEKKKDLIDTIVNVYRKIEE